MSQLRLPISDTLIYYFTVRECHGLHSLRVESQLTTAKNPERLRTRYETALSKEQLHQIADFIKAST